MTETPDAYELREQHWPLLARDPELTESAAAMISELVRYLNHATMSGATEAVPYAATLYGATGSLAAAGAGLRQLCAQLADRAAELAQDPNARHDQHRGDAEVSREHAVVNLAAAAELLADAAGLAAQLGDRLALVQGELTWISRDE